MATSIRPPWRLVLLVGAAVSVFAAAVSSLYTILSGVGLWTRQPDATATVSFALAFNMFYWGSWAALTPLILRFSERYRMSAGAWRRPLAILIAGGFLFVGVHAVIAGTSRYALQSLYGLTPRFGRTLLYAYLGTLDWEMSFYFALVGLAHALLYYRDAQERALRAARLETQLTEARLEALQRQLHPHFLFNTLHAISALVYENPRAADRMIERLSELLRLTLRRDRAQEVPLREELEFLDAYLDIERAHHGDRLHVEIVVPPQALDALVPTLVLQPLVENAIRHGVARRPGPGTVRVEASVNGTGELKLRVEDDGRGAAGVSTLGPPGVGLTNTQARLAHLYGDRHRLEFSERAGGGLTVTMTLPMRT
jgi:two-component system LytT family sensor kinase